MTDREKYLTILDRFYRGRGGSLLTKDESEALDYAISSIKTDLKYDLLYEETKHIANVSKMIEPTTKNCRSCRNFGSHHGICEICKDNKCWTEITKNDLADGKDNNVTSKITREEVIEQLQDAKDGYKEYLSDDAINMAIKALEQEPAPKNDLGVKVISKSDVDRIINCPYFRQADKLIQIMNLPPVTPQETRKGHWIGHREHCENLGVMPSGLGAYEWCSNCDCGIDVREWHRNNYNFCPNCGADMREVEE